ncbi:MAG TPA: SDR family oxidoreductase [Brumimicrobium sp.]|nr:SDR family oxidoreductase [Brumimicrobium sp.]
MNKQFHRILITGSNGLLGQKLVSYCMANDIDFLATANEENRFSLCSEEFFKTLDVTIPSQVNEVILKYKPTHILNAAALTNVDACEDHAEVCNAVNVTGVKNILQAIERTDIHLTQISTDFIFDGEKKLYDEVDVASPLSEYGKSKWEAEKLLTESNHKNVAILRTSILYGTGELLKKSNIFNWAMEQLRAGKELNIVNDQFRTPTFVDDLVQACFKVIEHQATGVYNISGGELRSMYEYILLVADYVGANKALVKPISSNQLNQKAARPRSSGLCIDKAKQRIAYSPTGFVESLFRIDPFN